RPTRRGALHRHRAGPTNSRHPRRRGHHRTALHPARHRAHARDRRRHARPHQGTKPTARDDRIRTRDRIPRGPHPPPHRSAIPGGGMNRGWLRRLWRTGTGKFGVIVIGVILVTAAVSLWWTPFDPQLATVADR